MHSDLFSESPHEWSISVFEFYFAFDLIRTSFSDNNLSVAEKELWCQLHHLPMSCFDHRGQGDLA